jgi:sugar lactone lactonase YvrE
MAADTGIVTTVVGNGALGFTGDNGPATAASLYYPHGIAIDTTGNLYIADRNNHRIRKVEKTNGIITTVVGSFHGDNGLAVLATLDNVRGVTVDNWGNYYVSDGGHQIIRKVDFVTGIITTVAGNGTFAFSGDNGPATSASLWAPFGVANDISGNLYIADTYNNRIRKVTAATGIITTVADGLNTPTSVAVDKTGNLYIADAYNHRILKVAAGTGTITTLAGDGKARFAGDTGLATQASLNYPTGVAIDSYGNIYITDSSNHRIRKVTAATGRITTVAGNGTAGYSGDNGPASAASLNPYKVVLSSSGDLYIAEGSVESYNGRYQISIGTHVRKVEASTGIITTIAGGVYPEDLTIDNAGNLYIAGSSYVRKVYLTLPVKPKFP